MPLDERLAVGPRLAGIYNGRLTSWFGHVRPSAPAQRVHSGWDVAAPTGTNIRALGDGEVIRVRDWDSVSGYHQEITVHYDTAICYTLYGHVLAGSMKRVGERFKAGDILGKVGTSRDAMFTTPHAHIQCWKSSQAAASYSNAEAFDPKRLVDWYKRNPQ